MKQLSAVMLSIAAGILVPLSVAASPDCSQAGLARALDRLQAVGRLHNCEIELVERLSPDGMKHYMLWAADRTLIAGGERKPASFELEISPECDSAFKGPLEQHTFASSFGYSDEGIDFKEAITVRMGLSQLPRSLVIQEIDLASHRVTRRVACRLDPEEL